MVSTWRTPIRGNKLLDSRFENRFLLSGRYQVGDLNPWNLFTSLTFILKMEMLIQPILRDDIKIK